MLGGSISGIIAINMKNKPLHSAYQYWKSLDAKGMRLDLGPVWRILDRLGNPHHNFRTVLVAGTNGKGSVSAMIAAILQEARLHVGLYTSPHLIDFRERIKMDGRMIPQREFFALIDLARRHLDEPLTYFEVMTVVALLHFSRSKADIVVLEVGMGGRLDATNVADPEVSVITNVSLEHQQYLGKTLKTIACEKAGIIRDNGICITASRNGAVITALETICRDRCAALYRIGKDIKVRKEPGGTFAYHGLARRFRHLSLPLRGPHQILNAATALGTVELLAARGLPIEDRAFENGLRKTHWEGRLETLREAPTIVVDGAHNPAGVSALAKALRDLFPNRRMILIFGVLRDKSYGAMLKLLAPLTPLLVLTGITTTDRGLRPEALESIAHNYFKRVVVKDTAKAAIDYALEQAGQKDLVCATGSLFLVGEVKKILSKKNK